MLARMVVAGQTMLARAPAPVPSAYVVASVAEWDAVFANDAATLSGKTVEIVGTNSTGPLVINNRDMHAEGAPVTIRAASGASAPRVQLTGTTRGVTFDGFKFQMTGWPRTYSACFALGTGTFGKLRFLNCSFRHGYGAGLSDIDTAADLPEYDRIDNVETATTTSATYALTWKDPAATDGRIYFFNRGAETVHVAVGGSGVTATTGDTSCAPGSQIIISNLDPTSDTHFAIVSAAGTSEVNARAEIGLSHYLASAFESAGDAVLEDIEVRGCTLRDLRSGVKGLGPTVSALVWDNDFDRMYEDVIAVFPKPGASLSVFRNIACLPFSRSGTAENLNGDAGDPHGDQLQVVGTGTSVLGPIYYAGSRVRISPIRTGVNSQGAFITDNDNAPSYSDVFIISTMHVGGASNGLYLGDGSEPEHPVRDALIYGASVVDFRDASAGTMALVAVTDDGGSIYVGKSIAPIISAPDEPFMQDSNLALSDLTAVFPNLDDLATATTRAQIEAAMLPAADGLGLGMNAAIDAIDWTTDDPAAVIRWENVPSGVHWDAPAQQSPSAVVTFPLRKVLNKRASQAVSAGAGTEWRSVDTDGTTEVTAWTSSTGTIEPGQFIQIRATSSATGGGTVTASVTINGFEQSAVIETADTPTEYLIRPASAAYFQDPSTPGAGVTRITMRGKFRFPSLPTIAAGYSFLSGISATLDLRVRQDGSLTARVEDSTQAAVYDADIAGPGTIAANTWYTIEFGVNHATQSVRVTVNGTDYTASFSTAGTGSFQSNRNVIFLSTTAGTNPVPAGTFAADMSVDFGGVLRKAIPNDAATANADAWKQGAGSFTEGP